MESDAIVRDQSSESQKLAQVKPRLEQLIQSYDVPVQAFTPRQDRFAMNLLHMPLDKAYSIIGGVWKPGQTTPIHDHLTWALIGVYSGQEHETLYRRTDDKTDPRYAKLEKVSERVNTKGHVTVLSHNGIHKSRQQFARTHQEHPRIWPRHRQHRTTQLRPVDRRDWPIRIRLLQRSKGRRALLVPFKSQKTFHATITWPPEMYRFHSPSSNNNTRTSHY